MISSKLNVRYGIYGLCAANLILAIVLATTAFDAWQKVGSSPIPVYGDKIKVAGRHFSNNDYTTKRVTPNYTEFYCRESWSSPQKAKGRDVRFIETVLYLSVNSSEPVNVAFGSRIIQWERRRLDPDDVWSLTWEYDGFRETFNLEATFLETNLTLSNRILGKYYENYWHDDLDLDRYFEQQSPAIFWNSSKSVVNFNLTEIWEYTPLLYYDKSVIKSGLSALDRVTVFIYATMICDIVVALTILGLSLKKNEVE